MRIPAKSLLLLIQLLAVPAFAQVEPPARVGRVNLVSGALAFYGPGDSDWSAAKVNSPVGAGAWLATDPQSRAELRIGADSLDLANNTQLDFAELRDRVMQIALTQGRLDLHLRRLQPDETAEIDVPRGGVWLLQPGVYDIDSGGPDRPARVTVFEGSARFVGGGVDTLVKAGDALVLSGGDTLSAAVEHAAPDDFVLWCRAHDYDEKRLASTHHVSPAMTGYEQLDEYGEWAAAPAYGEVWYPRSVPAGWTPYRDGRWVWVEPWGWNWVDDAPWGFAPCHYGRWTHIDDRWGWVPGELVPAPIYAPALVAFIPAPAISVPVPVDAGPPVGWFPLAPGEVYWPAYTRNPTYIRNVNITNVNVTKIDTIIAARPAASGPPPPVVSKQFANRAAATVVPARARLESRQVASAAVAVPPQVLRQAAVAVTPPVLPRPAGRSPAATVAAPPAGHTMPLAPGSSAAPIQPPSSMAAQAKLAGPAAARPPARPNFSELAPAPRVSPIVEAPRKSPAPLPGGQAPAAGARLPTATPAPAPSPTANAAPPAPVPGHPPGAPDFSHLAPARVGPHSAPQPAQNGPQLPANPAPAGPAPAERIATPEANHQPVQAGPGPVHAPPAARPGMAQPPAPDHAAQQGAAAETAARQQAQQRAAAEAADRRRAAAAQQGQQRAVAEAAARQRAVAAQQAQQHTAAEAAARQQAVAAQQAQHRAAAEAAARQQAAGAQQAQQHAAAQQAQQRAAAEAAARQQAAGAQQTQQRAAAAQQAQQRAAADAAARQPQQHTAAGAAAQRQQHTETCGHPGQPACPK